MSGFVAGRVDFAIRDAVSQVNHMCAAETPRAQRGVAMVSTSHSRRCGLNQYRID